MPQTRSIVTAASVIVAIACAGWAVYVTRQAGANAVEPTARPAMAARGGAGAPEAREVPVITAEVRREAVSRELKALGTARANESVEITSKVSNIVTAVKFRDGESVKAGQVLVELDGAQARAELAAAEAALAESRSQLERSRELLSTQVVSRAQFDQLEATMKANAAQVDAAAARVSDTIIRAPFAGRVGLRRVSLGSLVSPGDIIATLDDTSVIKADFGVPENQLGNLEPGLAIEATTTAYAGRAFTGRVTGIDSRVDPVTRSVTVRALIPNNERLLRAGMFLNVTIERDAHDSLVVPEHALVPEQSRQYVYVVSDGKATKREVSIGRRMPGSVEITAGLDAGERVIVEGTQKVREGTAVREATA